jgi:hypothetical protein
MKTLIWHRHVPALMLVLYAVPAAAAEVTPATMNVAPLRDFVLALAAAIVSSAVPVLVPALLVRLRLSRNVALSGLITGAAQRAAGIAYHALVSAETNSDTVVFRNAAVAEGTRYVLATLPATVAALGLSPEHVAAMVTGELGRLLAVDPNTSIPSSK